MIELTTITGLRRSVLPEHISDIAELSTHQRSSTAITKITGEMIYVADDYDEVMEKYRNALKKPASLADDTSN